MSALPLLALSIGDPAGIGPEICARALIDPDLKDVTRLVAIGPAELRPESVPLVDSDELRTHERGWIATEDNGPWTIGKPQEAGGRAALGALRLGVELASAGRVDGLVTAPVSKEALHLAGERVEGQTTLLARWAGAPRVEMLAVARDLRVMLATRPLPLREAIESLSSDGITEQLVFLHHELRRLSGIEAPRIALAGLNPHAGEAGILGWEELELLEPAVARAREDGVDVSAPESPDTVFLRAARGAYDAVLALYHDQALIPVKLHAPDDAITVLLGLPYLRVSPAHGTAFDIAGRGEADPRSLFAAIRQAAAWSRAPR